MKAKSQQARFKPAPTILAFQKNERAFLRCVCGHYCCGRLCLLFTIFGDFMKIKTVFWLCICAIAFSFVAGVIVKWLS